MRNQGINWNMTDKQETFTGVKEVQSHLRLDTKKLEKWLVANVDGFTLPFAMHEFRGGQSNPTYQISTDSTKYVLRRKPPGELLPSAHAVDREYRVISALYKNSFPVPKTFAMCTDNDVIGSIFYVMEMVEGRIFWDLSLPSMSTKDRTEIYGSLVEKMALLHSLDFKKVGLRDFGKTSDYMARQIHRWTKIYRASEPEEIPLMNKLNEWLPKNIPAKDETCIIHGDFRLDNTIVDPIENKIIAVLDWELSTLGHPIGDFIYSMAPWFIPSVDEKISSLEGLDLPSLGIPTAEEYIESYCRISGRGEIENLDFYKTYTVWRLAAIYQGIIKRGLDGTAASSDAPTSTFIVKQFAERAGAYAGI